MKTKKVKLDGSGEGRLIQDHLALHRMNYLLHLARLCCLHAVELKRKGDRKALHTALASRVYIKSMRELGSKTTTLQSIHVKHLYCKNCSLYLLDGFTSQIEFINDDSKRCFYTRTCLGCGLVKRWLIKGSDLIG